MQREPLKNRKHIISILTEKFGLRCWYCGDYVKGQSFHIDHIYPVSCGGSNDIANLAIACKQCNMAKGSLQPENFIRWLDFVRSSDSKTLFTPTRYK